MAKTHKSTPALRTECLGAQTTLRAALEKPAGALRATLGWMANIFLKELPRKLEKWTSGDWAVGTHGGSHFFPIPSLIRKILHIRFGNVTCLRESECDSLPKIESSANWRGLHSGARWTPVDRVTRKGISTVR
eukprot:1189312-Prorocentrum_minimum.AAC.3